MKQLKFPISEQNQEKDEVVGEFLKGIRLKPAADASQQSSVRFILEGCAVLIVKMSYHSVPHISYIFFMEEVPTDCLQCASFPLEPGLLHPCVRSSWLPQSSTTLVDSKLTLTFGHRGFFILLSTLRTHYTELLKENKWLWGQGSRKSPNLSWDQVQQDGTVNQ